MFLSLSVDSACLYNTGVVEIQFQYFMVKNPGVIDHNIDVVLRECKLFLLCSHQDSVY